MKKINLMLLSIIVLFTSCKKEQKDVDGGILPSFGNGTFTFKGKTYSGICSVIPESTDVNSTAYPGFHWNMSIHDDKNDAFINLGMFPQDISGEFGISSSPSTSFGWNYSRTGVIGFGGRNLHTVKYGKIKKLSKTKFSIQGFAYADLSTIPIPFTAEGDITDLTGNFNITNKSPYPSGMGLVSFYTTKPLANDTLHINVWKNLVTREFKTTTANITYHHQSPYKCGESESFYYDKPGTYYYEVADKKYKPISSGSFTVTANACNPVLINH